MPEARFWRDTLGFVVSEMEAIRAEMLANEDCDAVGSARRDEDIVPNSELRLVGCEDARTCMSIRGYRMDRKVAYLTSYYYD